MTEPLLFIRYDELLGFFFRAIIHFYLTNQSSTLRLHKSDDRFDNIVWAKDESGHDIILAFFEAKPRDIQKFAYSVGMPLENAKIIRPSDYSGTLEDPLYRAIGVFHSLTEREYHTVLGLLESDPELFSKFRNDPRNDPLLRRRLYKYCSATSAYAQKIINGDLSFCNPRTFNDPFDCDCQIIVNGSTRDHKDKFRVLALAPRPDDILMWAYYGEDHKGIAVEHEIRGIIQSLCLAYRGIIVYGNVQYTNARPQYKTYGIPAGSASFVIDLAFQVRCCFTKYKGWKHENEFRILAFENGFLPTAIGSNPDYMTINDVPTQVFQGAKFIQPNPSLIFPSGTRKLKKDPKNYKLNP